MGSLLKRSFHHQLLDLSDRLRRVQALRAYGCAVHNGVAAIKPKGVLKMIEALSGRLVARIHDPAIGLQQGGGTQEPLLVPPIGWARGRAAGTEDALVQTVELRPLFGRL